MAFYHKRKGKNLCHSGQNVRFCKLMKFVHFFSRGHHSFGLNVKCSIFFKSPAPLQTVATLLISIYQTGGFDIVILIGLLKLGIPCAIDLSAPES